MKKRVWTTILILALAASAAPTLAQEGMIELMRSDIRADKVKLLTAGMGLSDEQAAKFWPIYREYETELAGIGDQRVKLIKEYADNFGSMTDELAGKLAMGWFDLHEQRTKLWKQTYKRVEKELSATVAARFIQAENQINLLLDMQIASQIPLIGTGAVE